MNNVRSLFFLALKSTLFVLIPLFSIAQGVVFEKNLNETFQKARKSNLDVFIYYYNEDCSVCKKTQKLFEENAVGTYYNQNFVSYKINTRHELSKEDKSFIASLGFNFESVPFLLYIDPNGNYLHHSGSRSSVNEINELARVARNPNLRNASLQKKYQSGDRSVRTLYAYADLLRLKGDTELLTEVTKHLFDAFPKKDLSTAKSYVILKNVIVDIDNGFFTYWINHLDKITGLDTGMRNGNEKSVLEEILLKYIARSPHKTWSNDKKREVMKMIVTLGITNNPEVFFED